MWGNQLQMSWYQYRAALKKICTSCWSLPVVYDWSELKDNDFVVPMDDDDFPHPQLSELIESEIKNYDTCWFNVTTHEMHKVHMLHEVQHQLPMMYCLKVGTLRKLPYNDAIDLVHGHIVYEKLVNKHQLKAIRFTRQSMGLFHRHLGSHSILRLFEGEQIETLIPRVFHPIPLDWYTPQCAEVIDLVKGLRKTV